MGNQYDDEYKLSGMEWGTNIAGGMASGAAAGSALGPWGAAGGAVIGGGIGVAQSVMQQQELKREAERQAEMQKAIDQQNADFEMFRQGQNLSMAMNAQQQQVQTQQAAAQGGLTPEATAALMQEVEADAARTAAVAQPQMAMAAEQNKRANIDSILQQYTTAQDLANNTQPSADAIGAIGGIGGSLAELKAAADSGWGQAPDGSSAKAVVPDGAEPTKMTDTLGQDFASSYLRNSQDQYGLPYRQAEGGMEQQLAQRATSEALTGTSPLANKFADMKVNTALSSVKPSAAAMAPPVAPAPERGQGAGATAGAAPGPVEAQGAAPATGAPTAAAAPGATGQAAPEAQTAARQRQDKVAAETARKRLNELKPEEYENYLRSQFPDNLSTAERQRRLRELGAKDETVLRDVSVNQLRAKQASGATPEQLMADPDFMAMAEATYGYPVRVVLGPAGTPMIQVIEGE